jgi:hypothetical protein
VPLGGMVASHFHRHLSATTNQEMKMKEKELTHQTVKTD